MKEYTRSAAEKLYSAIVSEVNDAHGSDPIYVVSGSFGEALDLLNKFYDGNVISLVEMPDSSIFYPTQK